MLFFVWCYIFVFFFFKQKTAYEMRISDWSSDVCSSDLPARRKHRRGPVRQLRRAIGRAEAESRRPQLIHSPRKRTPPCASKERPPLSPDRRRASGSASRRLSQPKAPIPSSTASARDRKSTRLNSRQ